MKLKLFAVNATLLMAASGAMAIPVTLVGTHIDVVYEAANQGLFGIPTLTGDSISWTPSPSFLAKTTGPKTVTSQAQITVIAHTGFDLTTFAYSEGGSYRKPTSGSLLVSATGTVNVAGFVPPAAPISTSFSTGFLPTTNGATVPWSIVASTISVLPHTKKVSFDVTDTLKVLGPANGFISKTQPVLAVAVVAVPEPETVAMMLSGLFAIGFLVRRRRRD